jgi:hypothetical protein
VDAVGDRVQSGCDLLRGRVSEIGHVVVVDVVRGLVLAAAVDGPVLVLKLVEELLKGIFVLRRAVGDDSHRRDLVPVSTNVDRSGHLDDADHS